MISFIKLFTEFKYVSKICKINDQKYKLMIKINFYKICILLKDVLQ